MLQTIGNREVFVVEFDTMPELPITWNSEEERVYASILEDAIQNGIIIAPGKYGLAKHNTAPKGILIYTVFVIKE